MHNAREGDLTVGATLCYAYKRPDSTSDTT